MTARRSAASQAAAETPAASPSQGGSYIREPDGSLTRVEFTNELPAEPQPEAPEGTADGD